LKPGATEISRKKNIKIKDFRLRVVAKILCFVCFALLLPYASNAQQSTGILKGTLTDNNQEFVEFANVYNLQNNIGTFTDSIGRYRLVLPAGDSLTIGISHASYQPKSYRVFIEPDSELELNFQVAIREITGVVIEDTRMRTRPMETISIRSAKELPMVSQGVEGLLTGALGVVLRNELSSAYSVRGGSYDENLIYVNDIEVYRPFLVRVGQQEGLSFPNVDMIGSIAFSAGGFEARYGDKLSSVLDIKYKKPTEMRASLMASLLGGSVHFEDASKNRRFTHITGIRYRTYQYILGSLDTQGEYRPWFSDLQTYLTYDISERLEVGFLGSYSQNNYNFRPETRETEFGPLNETLRLTVFFEGEERTKHETGFGALAFDYKASKVSLLKFTTSFFATQEKEHFDILGEYRLDEVERDLGNDEFGEVVRNRGVGGYLNHARNNLEARVYAMALKGFHDFERHYFQWGANYQHEQIFDRINEWQMLDSAGYSLIHPSDSVGYSNPSVQPSQQIVFPYVLKTDLSLQSNRVSAYIQDSWSVRLKNDALITTNFGVRANYWDYSQQLVVSPRGNISYKPKWEKQLNDSTVLSRDVVFKFATGYYYQPPFYRELRDFNGVLNPEIRAQKSIHFVLGSDLNFMFWGRPFKFISELYYKHLIDIIPYEIENVRIRYYADNNANGYATGIDLKLNGEFIAGIESWASISLMQTKENIDDDYFIDYYNASGEQIYPGYTADQVAVDSVLFIPGLIPRPTDQRLNFNLFFQDEMPSWPRFKVHLSLLYGTGLPFGPPSQERYKDTLRTPSYKRIDIGFSYDIVSSTKPKSERKAFKNISSATLSAEIFNLFGSNNIVSYQWIRDTSNRSYAIPNYLTNRLLNVKFVVRI
jgi:hypothetical protein